MMPLNSEKSGCSELLAMTSNNQLLHYRWCQSHITKGVPGQQATALLPAPGPSSAGRILDLNDIISSISS
jgi:hypothetical protein